MREFDQIADALRTSADELDRRGRARETAEAALRESEERFRTLAESLPQLVWTSLPDGHCDYLSRQLLDYTGMSAGDRLDSEQLKCLIHPDDFAATAGHWVAAHGECGAHLVLGQAPVLAGCGRHLRLSINAVQNLASPYRPANLD